MKATVKQIFNEVSYLNPTVSTISSLGDYVSQSSQMVADAVHNSLVDLLPEGTLARRILLDYSRPLTEKQLWVIAHELLKNDSYCEKLGTEIAERQAKENAKREASKAKLTANKENAQPVLDFVKQNGRKLGDYYAFLKGDKTFKKEFFNKKYTMESANAFINS